MNEQAHSGWSFLKPRSTDPLSGELSINWEQAQTNVCACVGGQVCVLWLVYLIGVNVSGFVLIFHST